MDLGMSKKCQSFRFSNDNDEPHMLFMDWVFAYVKIIYLRVQLVFEVSSAGQVTCLNVIAGLSAFLNQPNLHLHLYANINKNMGN